MPKRKPQINFQVDGPFKTLYEEAKLAGLSPTRLCAAGLLLMLENPTARLHATSRLRAWEQEYARASATDVRAFLDGVQAALTNAAPEIRPAPPARGPRAAARRAKSG